LQFAGASGGIGLAAAHQLLTRGWQVLAAARRVEAIEFLQCQGAHELPLDMAEAASR
jgi:NADP-dependent 3-hydroxy acid dehydrogenase YdfG